MHKAHNISWRTSSGSGRDSASASETHEDALLPHGAIDTTSATSVWLQHVVQHSSHMLAQLQFNNKAQVLTAKSDGNGLKC